MPRLPGQYSLLKICTGVSGTEYWLIVITAGTDITAPAVIKSDKRTAHKANCHFCMCLPVSALSPVH